jgi:hypothetical protein
MAEYLLERYLVRTDPEAVRTEAVRARQAAEELRRENIPIRFVRSLYLPEDETCFYLYEAETIEQVREAARRAALPFEHITRALGEAGST